MIDLFFSNILNLLSARAAAAAEANERLNQVMTGENCRDQATLSADRDGSPSSINTSCSTQTARSPPTGNLFHSALDLAGGNHQLQGSNNQTPKKLKEGFTR